MDKKYKKDLGYFLFFNKLKRSFKENVGEVVEKRIHTEDEQFLNDFNKPVIIENLEEIVRKPKKYDIYNKSNGHKVGELDRNLDVYNNLGLYCGTIKSANKMLIIILTILLTMIALFCLSIHLIDISSDGRRPVLIEITEADGKVVTSEFNVFTDINGDDIIYPGKEGEYLFEISNLNKFDVVLSFAFSEKNEMDIPMVYTISDRNGYIIGNKDKYVSIEHLDFGNIVVDANESIYFELDWLWQTISDEQDTAAGVAGDTVYTIIIDIMAYEKEK